MRETERENKERDTLFQGYRNGRKKNRGPLYE